MNIYARIVIAVVLAQSLIIFGLLLKLNEKYFSVRDMSFAYLNGCTIGQNYINSTKFTCAGSTKDYFDKLTEMDSLDEQ